MQGFEILVKPDGIWFSFVSSKGQYALVSVASIAEKHGPIVSSAIRQWAKDRMAETAGQ